MNSITLIPSVIMTPNTPLSYTNTRSVYSREERFEQTKLSISSAREKIPGTRILLIECSPLTDSEKQYFVENVDYFINIYDTNNEPLINRMFTQSKAMGEGTMTIVAIQYLLNNYIQFDHLFKMSGRYWLNDNFNFEKYDNNMSCVYNISMAADFTVTCLYKLTHELTVKWCEYLINSEVAFMNCISFECIFAEFIKNHPHKLIPPKIGMSGYISVSGDYIDI